MNDSYRLGRILGIDIRLHWSMPILLLVFWIALSGPLGIVPAALLLLGLEAIVLLHELGHSVVAKSYGLEVIDITFWPLGGMARMSAIPEDTKIETTIALAGPAVNFLLAGLALPAVWLLGGTELAVVVNYFLVMNLVLGGFNLLPAFPMDGGRVLRALLASDGDWLRATERAVRVGRWMALAMVVSVFVWGHFMLLFIAGFVWLSGQKELMAMRMRHTGSPFRMDGIQEALRRAAAGAGAGGGGRTPFGTGPLGGAPFGDAPREPAWEGGAPGEARRPSAQPPASPAEGRGWSDEEIAELEGFHGRLRQFRDDEA